MNSAQPGKEKNVNDELLKKTEGILDALEGFFGPEERPQRDPVAVLVRGILSQNTSDANSGRAFDALMEFYGGWERIRTAPPAQLQSVIRSSGLSRQKTETIQASLTWLHGRGGYDPVFLDSMPVGEAQAQLTAIKGVGIKTARLVLLFGFGKATFVVDTHVLRVCKRLGLLDGSSSRIRAHEVMSELIPPERTYSAHMHMIRLGRRFCHPASPDCGGCPVKNYCLHFARH